jgi:hypothetical protein
MLAPIEVENINSQIVMEEIKGVVKEPLYCSFPKLPQENSIKEKFYKILKTK